MCLDPSFEVGFSANAIADLLSHMIIVESRVIWNTRRSCRSHNNSLVREAKALYSASAEDLATVGCFFDFQHMRDEPK